MSSLSSATLLASSDSFILWSPSAVESSKGLREVRGEVVMGSGRVDAVSIRILECGGSFAASPSI